jgi:secreted PhoX family phosphatase
MLNPLVCRDDRTERARRLSERPRILLVAIAAFAWLCGSPGFISEVQAGISLANLPVAPAAPALTQTQTFPQTVTPAIYASNPMLNSLSVFPIGSNGNVPSLFGKTLLSNPNGIAYSEGNIYVTNAATNSITVYPANSNGNPNPITTIIGSSTLLDDPVAIAMDSGGNIYVANRGSPAGDPDSITIYSADSGGNVTPTAVITGPNTGLEYPDALTLDSKGNIYVANEGSIAGLPDSITVYSPGSNGNSAPANIISGSSTALASPGGVAVDANGYIYATSLGVEGVGSVAVLIYAPGSTGNIAPTTSIDGDCAVLTSPGAIALDSNQNVYLTNPGNVASSDESVAVFTQQDIGTEAGTVGTQLSLEPGPPQCLTPMSNIFGGNTEIDQPFGIAVDPAGNMYVTNSDANSVTIFSAGSTGNIAPIATIADPNTGLDNPLGIALDSSGNIYVANAGSQDGAGGSDSITVYPAGSNANVSPTTTISAGGAPDNTGLNYPDAITVTPNYGIYVANALGGAGGNGSITWYAAGSNGNVSPSIVISGANTGLNDPTGLALGTTQSVLYLYVLNASGGPDAAGSVTIYRAYTSGDPAPAQEISGNSSGDQTGFNNPSSIAVDSSNNIYVTNDGSTSDGADSVTIYAASSNGNVAPTTTISGSNTELNLPNGIVIDSNGLIYVANDGSVNGGIDTITVYSPGSSGNVAPITTISGTLTWLGQPSGLAVGP